MKVHETINTWFACKALLQERGCALSSSASWSLMYKSLSLCAQCNFQGKARFGLWLKKPHSNRYREGLEAFSSLRIHQVHGFQPFWTPLAHLCSMCLWNKLLAQGGGSGSRRRDGHRKKRSKGTIQPILSYKFKWKANLMAVVQESIGHQESPLGCVCGGLSFLIQGLTLLKRDNQLGISTLHVSKILFCTENHTAC